MSQATEKPTDFDHPIRDEDIEAAHLLHFAADRMGDDGWLVRRYDEMRKFNYIGDCQIITGEVTGKRVVDGAGHVDLEFRAADQRGEVTVPATATATVALPSRELGPVLLPKPSAALERTATAMMTRHRELASGRTR